AVVWIALTNANPQKATNTRSRLRRCRFLHAVCHSHITFKSHFAVISSTEVLFKPHVCNDEKIAATHFLNLELWRAGSPIAPCYRNNRPGIAPHNRLQWQLHGEIEMRGKKRGTPAHRLPAKALKAVGRS